MSERYTFENFVGALREPEKFVRESRRITDTIGQRAYNPIFRAIHGNGVDVMAREWDNLILLDACRADFFESVNTIGGDLEMVVSQGGHSWEFMEANFLGRELRDTVYVTANPHTEKLPDSIFYAVEPVYQDWDQEKETVMPEVVAEWAIEAYEKYPDKRIIVHFMQPHKPHLGPTAEDINDRLDFMGWDKYHGHEAINAERTGVSVWDAVQAGHVTSEELKHLYEETLEIALGHVKDVVNALDGLSVITADHGEMLGERGNPFGMPSYGHPHGVCCRELNVVPWLRIEGEVRRQTWPGEPEGFERLDEQVVNNRLESLGYVT